MRIEKGIFVGIIFLALNATVSACPECRAQVDRGIYNQDFSSNLFVLLLPIFILTTAGVGLYFADDITEKIKEQIGAWRTKEHAAR